MSEQNSSVDRPLKGLVAGILQRLEECSSDSGFVDLDQRRISVLERFVARVEHLSEPELGLFEAVLNLSGISGLATSSSTLADRRELVRSRHVAFSRSELAAALGQKPWYVTMMKRAGFKFNRGSKSTLASAEKWLEENPTFSANQFRKASLASKRG